ncbi:MAG TPA: AMP-binding protein, partial [Ktedonobacterales bacterium]|nr:AMP-binding protein [Ktedonobacterales bacterium]
MGFLSFFRRRKTDTVADAPAPAVPPAAPPAASPSPEPAAAAPTTPELVAEAEPLANETPLPDEPAVAAVEEDVVVVETTSSDGEVVEEVVAVEEVSVETTDSADAEETLADVAPDESAQPELAAPVASAAPSAPSGDTIDALLQESRVFAPSEAFVAQANIADPSVYERAAADPQAFWAEAARRLDWFTPPTQTLEWDPPHAKWFGGGALNASYNCVDRHLRTFRRNKAAIIWEGEPGDKRVLTYRDLYREVNQFAAVLQELGVRTGDRVAFYMPMIPELAIGLLACARIGAPHTVIFGGFSAEALRDRIQDSGASVCVTADGGWRRGGVVPLKDTTDAAVELCPTITHVLVVQRVGPAVRAVAMQPGRDVWYHELAASLGPRTVAPVPLESEHPLYIMYTSGTTGKPKGQLHTTAGYLVGTALSHQWIFDLKEDDVYWCTADIGWVTGHSYIVYGPLANGATCLLYEGSPDYPDKDRFWALVE